MKIIDSFADYLDHSPQYGLIVAPDFAVLHCNTVLSDCSVETTLETIFGESAEPVKKIISQSIGEHIFIREELNMSLEGAACPVYVHVCPITAEIPAAIVKFHSVESRRWLERVMFARRVHLPADAIWKIDEDYRVLYFRTDQESIFYGRESGFNIFEAIPEDGHVALEKAFLEAKANPTHEVSIEMDVIKGSGLRRVEAEITFAPDMFHGNAFFCISRGAVNTAPHVLNRMKEAWQVEHDWELAQKIGASPSGISRARNGYRQISADWILQCCRETGVLLQWIDSGVGPKRWEDKI